MKLQRDIIYHMDYLELMLQMEDGVAGLILTDPPYGINYQNQFTQHPHRCLEGDSGIDYARFSAECYRVLQNNAHAYFFTRFDKYPEHYRSLIEAGFTVKNCLIIEKGAIGGIGDLNGSFANNSEWVIFCQKGRRPFNQTKLLKNKCRGQYQSSTAKSPTCEYKTRFPCCWFGRDYPKATYNPTFLKKAGICHPTVKNRTFLEWLINISSAEGALIFDPFMGTGSTAIAALHTGRHFLGCEIDQGYYNTGLQQIQAAQM